MVDSLPVGRVEVGQFSANVDVDAAGLIVGSLGMNVDFVPTDPVAPPTRRRRGFYNWLNDYGGIRYDGSPPLRVALRWLLELGRRYGEP
jgi:hypothetical protein